MTAGQKLRAYRGERTQQEVANAINISRSALQMYENDMRRPRDELKRVLAEFYGTTVGSLFFDQE